MNDFDALARQAEADPERVDFVALRRAYVQSKTYMPAKHIMGPKLMQITDNAKDFAEVAGTCRNILSANPMDLEARRMLAFSLEKTGHSEEAEGHNRFNERMIDAILVDGDGKSFETAWTVIAEAEIWTLFKVFGMNPGDMTRHQRPDGIFNVFEGLIDERTVTMYFNVTTPVKFTEKLVGE